jgi:hypothetical protein
MEKKCELKIVFGRGVLATGKTCLFTRIFWRSDILLGMAFWMEDEAWLLAKSILPLTVL